MCDPLKLIKQSKMIKVTDIYVLNRLMIDSSIEVLKYYTFVHFGNFQNQAAFYSTHTTVWHDLF